MTKHTLLVGFVACWSIACGGSPPPPEPCAGGVRPALAECTYGLTFAECGGDQPARFACDEFDGRCRWFVGGCVAEGFRESDCENDELCCMPTESGTWPFTESWAPSDMLAVWRTIEDTGAYGGAPILRDAPTSISVSIDTSLGAPAVPGVECAGEIPYEICRESPLAATHVGDALVVYIQPMGVISLGLTLEIVRDSGGTLIARTFPRYVTDGAFGAPACERAHTPDPVPIVEGTLALSTSDITAPGTVHGEAHLTIDSVAAVVRF